MNTSQRNSLWVRVLSKAGAAAIVVMLLIAGIAFADDEATGLSKTGDAANEECKSTAKDRYAIQQLIKDGVIEKPDGVGVLVSPQFESEFMQEQKSSTQRSLKNTERSTEKKHPDGKTTFVKEGMSQNVLFLIQ